MILRRRRLATALAAAALALAAAGAASSKDKPVVADPEAWPRIAAPPRDAEVEGRVNGLMARMSLEEKVGQTLQADITSVTPADVKAYHLGSVLNGGDSKPRNNRRAAAADWLALADAFWEASTDVSSGGAGVPVIWGTDAVHGHSVAYGATIFPHNINLGAAGDPDLVRRIGAAVAQEVRVTGHDWTFAPTLAVPQDDRWGRTYEGFSEDPAIVKRLAGAYVEGLQGRRGSSGFLDADHVIATAKHFLGDGGTDGGVDQGNTLADEAALRDIHAAGYYAAVEAGVQTVMASYSSWQGEKMHGRKDLLTDVLKGRMGFDGFVVGDWNGHAQVPGCSPSSCAAAYDAGVDLIMVPTDWKKLYEDTLAKVRSKEIPQARLDDAVRRILRVKVRAGLLDEPKPSERRYAGDLRVLGSSAHRALAREAVRRSLVLLKNQGRILPLEPGRRVLVAGRGADDIGRQAGGWTLTWQGAGTSRNDFPRATTIWEGIEAAVTAAGGSATLSADGSFTQKPDVAVVVFGETPYAEGVGDILSVAYSPTDATDLETIRKLKAQGVPVVSVFLSGRPLWVNREINASDAFVAAFLPGTEGGGVADMLFEAPSGDAIYDFQGRLSYSWPRTAAQTPLNVGQPGYDPLFPVGYGLTYRDAGDVAQLPEDPGLDLASVDPRISYLIAGATLRPWRLTAQTPDGAPAGKALRLEPDEGRVELEWSGGAPARAVLSSLRPIDLKDKAGWALEIALEADRRPKGPVTLAIGGPGRSGALDVTRLLGARPDKPVVLSVPLSCFAAAGADLAAVSRVLTLAASEKLELEITDVRLRESSVPGACPA